MNIKFAGQMFFRKVIGFKNIYIVCGLIRSDQFPENLGVAPETEHIYPVSGLTIGPGENREKEAQGKDTDGILKSPFWRLKDN